MKDYVIDRNEFTPQESWSISNALHMMKLSYAVYAGTTDNVGAREDWSLTERLVRGAGYELRKIESRDGIFEPNAMLCWDDANVFLVFRGTEPTAWNQWATNANCSIAPFCIGGVHKGFLKSVDLIWPQVIQGLRDIRANGTRRLFVGGHSLGAGMSQAAVSRLAFEPGGFDVCAVYNFGGPRALDVTAAMQYNQRLGARTFRVVNNHDIVCEVPLEVMGYAHVGQLRLMNAEGRLQDAAEAMKPAGLLDKFRAFQGLDAQARILALRELEPSAFVTDHLPDRYTGKLAALNRRQ